MLPVVRIALILLLIAGASGWRLLADNALHIRVFRTYGSYPSTVSVSPNGIVVAKSGDSLELTVLDGYSRQRVSMPDAITYRVHQSRSGQIWSVRNEGLLLHHGDAWKLFALPEIQAFLSAPARSLRQIALLPAEVNHVLILLPDRLLDFEALSLETETLREAKDTGLGEFIEIQEGLDDAIWITGTRGAARLQGPARRLTAQSPWKEFLFAETNRFSNLQRVFESAPGELTGTVSLLDREARAIAQLRDSKWTSFTVPELRIRQAWEGWDDQVWGFSTVSLFRVNQQNDEEMSLVREPVSGPQYELAVETNGVFWIASGEGLVRYAPHLWRTPPELEDVQASVYSLLFQPDDNAVWLGTSAGLVWQRGNERRTFPRAEAIENLPPRQSMYLLRNGEIVVGEPNRALLLDPKTGKFTSLASPPGVRVHLVGQLLDGSVCAWFDRDEKEGKIDVRVTRGGDWEPLELPSDIGTASEVVFVKETSNGELWIGTGANLLRVHRATGTVEKHGSERGLRTDRVYALAEVGDGRLWCGTISRIYEFRGQRWETILNTQDRVTDITPAGGSIWVSTLSGIHRFQDNAWYIHSTSEGLPPGNVHSLRVSPDQKVWAGTSRGAFVFHPDADRDPPKTMPPRLEEEQTPAAGQPTVVYFRGQDKWDYTWPADLLFSYRLDEGNWSPYSNITSRTFHKLSAGTHVVEVQCMDRNGNRSADSSRIEFAVIVPWSSDPRLLSVLIMALVVTFVLAGFAVNRHFQLKRSYAEVEKIVAERTRELDRATQELVHSQKMRALGTMAAGIAHDFNNILSIIKGSAQIIESNVGDKDKIRTRVSRIQTVVEQGSVIVKALLGLGKTGTKELSECDLGQLLHDTRKLLSDRFPPSIQFQVNVSSDLPVTLCSPDVLQQVLLNLILNAAEAMHNEGVVELTASVVTKLPPKLVLEPEKPEPGVAFIAISVIDEGGGIPPENLPRIFEPFFTTKAFSSRRGTGLGLSMVYELAKALGYGLEVQSHVGQGSVFSILIPVITKAEGAAEGNAGSERTSRDR